MIIMMSLHGYVLVAPGFKNTTDRLLDDESEDDELESGEAKRTKI